MAKSYEKEPSATSAQLSAAQNHHYIQVETPRVSANFTVDAPKFTLQWENLSLSVSAKSSQTNAVEEKPILKNVSGFAKPGELLVIMGPSGAGKSSLLDCISGRNADVQGSIAVNGMPWTKRMRRFTSYVMQDDLFYKTITVREHLMFQAQLRMGKTFSKEQYEDRVDAVMEELGLTKCRDSLIGGMSVRGISGGERKRLSFATEILTNPSILFVDEPTSGLDSFMAETVVTQLQQLARDGRTVIATIHQPSSELFALFDQLYLLSDGSPVYHGRASESVEYFAALGYQCPPYRNPSDYFMRQLVVMDKESDHEGVARVEMFKSEWHKRQQQQSTFAEMARLAIVLNDTEPNYEDSRLHTLGQIGVVAKRNVVRIVRDHVAFRAAALQTLFISLLAGLVYLQLGLHQRAIQNFAGVFFFFTMNQTFIASSPVFVSVPLELPLVIREYKAGLYHLASWYISKNLSELPFQVLMPLIYFIPAYLMIGIGHGFRVYFYMQVMIMLINSTSVGLGYMVSCVCRRADIAPIMGVATILPFLLFGGLLINSDDVPVYFIWVQYISPVKYGFEGLMKLYWNEVPFIPCDELVETCIARTGAQVLANYSMRHRTSVTDALMLVVINIAFRTIGFIGLWFNVKSKA
ncbi:Atp-binding protein [Globisporangium polare]